MKIFIITDLEGISGITRETQVSETASPDYTYSLKRLMADTNAAIAGAFDGMALREGAGEGGADEVYVTDGHGGGNNFIPGELDPRAKQMRMVDFESFDEIDAFMHVGAHAMAGTINGFLDHTQSSKTWFNYHINGRRCGELAQGAILAGAYGAPYIMVSGDEAACVEARQFFGDIKTAAVKTAVGRNNAHCIDDESAVRLIYEAARGSIALIGKIKPFKPVMPMEITLEFTRADYCDAVAFTRDNIDRLDARKVRKVVNKIEKYRDIFF